MKLLADENIARQVVERLRADGHDVAFVLASSCRGLKECRPMGAPN